MAHGKSMKLGGGGRFAALEAKARAGGARDPGAVAAVAGRKKYGQAAMTRMAVAGRKRALKSAMPKGASMSPKGDIGCYRQREGIKAGGFSDGPEMVTEGKFGHIG